MKVSEMLSFAKKNVPTITEQMHRNMDNLRILRNCLIHNNGVADESLGFMNLQKGQNIILSSGQLNGYGLAIREYVRTLWDHIEKL